MSSRVASKKAKPSRLLSSRVDTAVRLGGISIASVIRLEVEGRLRVIRLSRSPTAQVFHPMEDVEALARGEWDDDEDEEDDDDDEEQ